MKLAGVLTVDSMGLIDTSMQVCLSVSLVGLFVDWSPHRDTSTVGLAKFYTIQAVPTISMVNTCVRIATKQVVVWESLSRDHRMWWPGKTGKAPTSPKVKQWLRNRNKPA